MTDVLAPLWDANPGLGLAAILATVSGVVMVAIGLRK